MTTKGPCNRYGNTRNTRKIKPKNISYEWAKDFNKYTIKNHVKEHSKNMKLESFESYRQHAIKFANYVDSKYCKSFLDKNNSTYKYNIKTNEFAIITKDGYIVTYYYPKEEYKYYKKQMKKYKKGEKNEK